MRSDQRRCVGSNGERPGCKLPLVTRSGYAGALLGEWRSLSAQGRCAGSNPGASPLCGSTGEMSPGFGGAIATRGETKWLPGRVTHLRW